MQFNENDKEREQRILHHFIYRGLKDGGGGGGGFENCAYLWKNSGYAPELFFQDNQGQPKTYKTISPHAVDRCTFFHL